jgi:hypothetical protein
MVSLRRVPLVSSQWSASALGAALIPFLIAYAAYLSYKVITGRHRTGHAYQIEQMVEAAESSVTVQGTVQNV